LDPLGVLHDEPRRLLLDDLRETAQAASILSLIGRGCHRMSEIAARLGKPATSLTRPLRRLLELGYIRREQPFGASPRTGKKTLYRIDDPFLAFWFRYVEPNRSRLQAGLLESVVCDIEKNIPLYQGEIWEEIVRRSVPHLGIEGMQWLPAQRWWGAGSNKKPLEIDVVSASSDGKALLVGEVKMVLSRKKLEEVERTLEKKVLRLPLARTYGRIIKKVFYLEGKSQRRNAILTSAKEVFRVLK
jgi:AAA+ ATPase superfamily predicted ATPase